MYLNAGCSFYSTGQELIRLKLEPRCQRKKFGHLAKLLKAFSMNVNGTQPIEKAFVTGGGVSVKEIVPKTMASRKKEGLYFCGEILDIHGYTGGYNITSALVTGRIAGMNAGEYATEY